MYYPSAPHPISNGEGDPIIQQPLQHQETPLLKDVCMNPSQDIFNCPSGLEQLVVASKILVQQKVEVVEVSPGIKHRTKYTVRNELGQKIYYPIEDSCFANHCCGALKASDMVILDNSRREVMHFHRPLGCDSCCLSFLESMTVSVPQGPILGTVAQQLSITSYPFVLKNAAGDVLLRIDGPSPPCLLSMWGDVNFLIISNDRSTQVGKITKKWSHPCGSDYDFEITFPLDLDVRMKATILGACFLIDAMFFTPYE